MQIAPDLFAHANRATSWPDGIPREVAELFDKLALDLKRRGFERYSADAILHQIRWTMHVDRDNRDFKCNDHWTAPLARWWLLKHPEHAGFFETRERRNGQ